MIITKVKTQNNQHFRCPWGSYTVLPNFLEVFNPMCSNCFLALHFLVQAIFKLLLRNTIPTLKMSVIYLRRFYC